MGYLLSFARSLQVKSQLNSIQLETMQLSNRRNIISAQLAKINASVKGVDESDPDVQYLKSVQEQLTAMDNVMELRLTYLQTREKQLTAEEQSLATTLDAQISSSAPKYS